MKIDLKTFIQDWHLNLCISVVPVQAGVRSNSGLPSTCGDLSDKQPIQITLLFYSKGLNYGLAQPAAPAPFAVLRG
jgi:hypothetical protein